MTKLDPSKINRLSRLIWIPVADTCISPEAQRELNPAFVDKLVADFDPEHLGYPVVSFRGGRYFIIDGQHRIEAIKRLGWGDQKVECEVFTDLTEQDEADEFLKRQQRLGVMPLKSFQIAVHAGQERYPVECEIDRVVRAEGFVVGGTRHVSIKAIGKLRKIFEAGGAECLGQTLRIIRDAYGPMGMTSNVLGGVGLVTVRYRGKLDERRTIMALKAEMAGLNGLANRANESKRKFGRPMPWCMAAAVVDVINVKARGAARLEPWIKVATTEE